MKTERKKEIDQKWHQLLSEFEKPKKTSVDAQDKKSSRTAKVIRRRKGNPDLHIT